jgi:hypothetical protein
VGWGLLGAQAIAGAAAAAAVVVAADAGRGSARWAMKASMCRSHSATTRGEFSLEQSSLSTEGAAVESTAAIIDEDDPADETDDVDADRFMEGFDVFGGCAREEATQCGESWSRPSSPSDASEVGDDVASSEHDDPSTEPSCEDADAADTVRGRGVWPRLRRRPSATSAAALAASSSSASAFSLSLAALASSSWSIQRACLWWSFSW